VDEDRIPFARALGAWLSPAIFGAWWARLRGRLRPSPCPYSLAAAFEAPGRRLVAGAERVLDRFGLRAGETVLEIGPGTGFYSIEAARRVGARGRLVCLDIQPEMLHHTKGRLEARGLEAEFVQADARSLPLRPSSVDHVFLIGVLGEIPDRTVALAEMRRVLRPGGRLSVSEQLPDPDFVTQRALRRELTAAGFAEEETRGWLFYTSRWSKPEPLAGASVAGVAPAPWL
jgi:SAM-dependent methyltransferase